MYFITYTIIFNVKERKVKKKKLKIMLDFIVLIVYELLFKYSDVVLIVSYLTYFTCLTLVLIF